MIKNLTILTLALMLIGTAWAQTGNVYHGVQIVDERGVNVTAISSVHIYAPDSVTDAVIYADKRLQQTMGNPITAASDYTTLSNGKITWYGPDGYNFSITDGTNIATNANHRERTSSEGTIVFPSYITAISSTTYSDAMSAVWGTNPAFTQSIAAGVMTFTPGADNVAFNIGVSGTTLNSDFNVFIGEALGLEIDAGDATFIWDGGAVLFNHDSDHSVGINTGTSTGTTTIGSSTSGALALETTAGFTILADDASSIKTSAGTLDIDSTGGDLGIDATDASLLIDAGESATDAIVIQATGAAGGVELISGTGDITLDSGDDIFLEANTGIGDVISIINTAGTHASAVIIQTVAAGCIDIDSGDNITVDAADDITLDTADGAVYLIADGVANGDVDIDAENDIILTTTGSLTITNTDPMTVSGAMDIIGTITLAEDEVISNATDDTVSVTSDSTHMTFQVLGNAAAGSAIIDLSADAANDDVDTWLITVADAGAMTIANDGTATMTISEAVTVSGLLTVAAITTPIEALVTTEAAEITDNGKVFILNHATEFATTLPTVASSSGVTFRFICKLAPDTGSFTIVTDTLEDAIVGSVVVDGANIEADGPDDTITFTASAAAIGDWVELTSDGTYWYLSGQGAAATSIVPTGT